MPHQVSKQHVASDTLQTTRGLTCLWYAWLARLLDPRLQAAGSTEHCHPESTSFSRPSPFRFFFFVLFFLCSFGPQPLALCCQSVLLFGRCRRWRLLTEPVDSQLKRSLFGELRLNAVCLHSRYATVPRPQLLRPHAPLMFPISKRCETNNLFL
ncbi:hypothetical protein LX36DRAFT_224624 [Colletotrichum falcatum]|nr:hypothetical protein LX36DRAFT_224624 [Colletotrichum falcatum]